MRGRENHSITVALGMPGPELRDPMFESPGPYCTISWLPYIFIYEIDTERAEHCSALAQGGVGDCIWGFQNLRHVSLFK